MEGQKRLKIVRFTAENFKKLKAVDITPKEGQAIVQITGANEAGKSSVLDGIWAVLEWADAKKAIERPIRDGAESAKSTIDLGEITVTRTWTAGGSYLTVANKDGAIFRSPQAVLDALKGQLSFDPLEFANMKDEDQRDLLMRITGLGPKTLEIDQKKQKAYEERTAVNREIRDLEGRQRTAEAAGAMAVLADPTVPDEEIQVTEILAKVEEAQSIARSNGIQRVDLKNLQAVLVGLTADIDELEKQIMTARAQQKLKQEQYLEIQAEAAVKKATVDALKDPDIEALRKEAAGADEKNKRVRAKKQYLQVDSILAEKKKKVLDLETEMTGYEQEKADLYKTSKMPIDGLTAGTAGVLYKGIPFRQCSSAEKLRVSTGMAMALNPTLRVIRINDGSLLDSKNLAAIEKMAIENDYTIWIEQVDETGKVGIYIEDGEIKSQG